MMLLRRKENKMNNSIPNQAVQVIGQIFNITLWNEDSTIVVAQNRSRVNPASEAQAELDYNNIKAKVVSAVTGDGTIRFHIKY